MNKSAKTYEELEPGDHLCCLYDTEEEHRALLTPFLLQGIEQNQKVIYIVDARTSDEVLAYLRGGDVNVEQAVEKGQLWMLSARESYLKDDVFDPDAMIDLLRAETRRAIADGYDALRVTGEMSWALQNVPGTDRLIEYEIKLNEFFAGNRALALCQYDRRRFQPATLLNILRTHPIAVIGTEVYENFYYIPPADLRGENASKAELNNWIENLSQSKRTRQALEEREHRLQEIFNNANDALYFHTLADNGMPGSFLEVNQKACEMLGYSRDEFRQMTPQDIDATEKQDEVPQVMSRLHTEDNVTFEMEHMAKDGTKVPVEINAHLFVTNGDRRVLSVARDITERKQAEKDILRLNSLLRAVRDVNQAIIEANDPEALIQQSCEILLRRCQYEHVWAATFDPDGAVQYTANAGVTAPFTELISAMASGWRPKCVRRALAEPGTPFALDPASHCERDCPLAGVWQGSTVLRCGFPEGTGTVGLLGFALASDHEVNDEEKHLIVEVAGDVAHGLQRLNAEQELKQSEERYRRLFETAQDGMLILDAETGEIMDANPYIKQILGYSKDELVGNQLWQVGPFRHVAENKKRFRELVDRGYIRYEDLPMETKDGSEAWVEFVSNTYEAGGKNVVQCNIRDTTERKQAEEAQRQLHELLTETGRMARVGGWEIDLETETVKWTQVTREIHEVSDDYVPSLEEAIEFFAPEVQPKLREAIRRARQDGTPFDMELPLITANDHKLWTHASGKAEFRDGKCVRLHGMFQDITTLRQTEKELEETNQGLQVTIRELEDTRQQLIDQERQRALSTMASGIAHDFNNALSPIQGFSKMLLDNPDMLDDRQKTLRYLGHIHKSASNAAETIRRMRKFYRPSEEDTFTELDLNSIITDAVSMTQPRWKEEAAANGKHIDIQTELGDIPAVSGNEAELNEILTNLIFNAVDAIPNSGGIRIRTWEQDGNILLDFNDNGTGMPEETRRKCLDPFYTTKGTEGSGLGLATIRGIIQRHNGEITIESTEGEGTTFRITLPQAQSASAKSEEQETSSSRPLQILVAEDEESQRELLHDLLTGDGHNADVTADGVEGLEKFNAGWFDLVITDRAMPEMNCDDLAAKIKETAPDKPVIMLTGFGDMMDAAGEKPDNVDAVLSKPVTKEKLREAIGEIV